MYTATSLKSLFLAFIVLLSPIAHAQELSSTQEASAWRERVNGYFLAYAKRDIEGVLSWWSRQSAEQLAAQRKALSDAYVAYEKIELGNVVVRKATVEGDQASVRAVVEMNFTTKGESTARVKKMNRTLRFVREATAWKVLSEEAAEKQLAASIAAAKTDEERQRLLKDDPELLTVELRDALLAQARTLRLKNNHEQALTVLDVARGVTEQINDKEGAASVFGSMGDIHALRGNNPQALDYYHKSLALRETLGDKAAIAFSLNDIGLVHKSQGNYAQALDYYQKSVALSEAAGDKRGAARALNNMGIVYEAQSDYVAAMETYQRSLAVSEAAGIKVFVGSTLNNIGNVNGAQGNYAQAIEFYQRSLQIRESLGDKAGIASTLNNIGVIRRLQGNYTRALETYQKSLELSEAMGNKTSVASTLNNIGTVHKSQGNYEQALKYYEQSFALGEKLGEKVIIARALNNIGTVHQDQHQFAQALDYYRKSLAVRESLGDKSGIAVPLNNIGEVHTSQGNYASALEYYQKSLALKETLGEKAGIANSLINIGDVYQRQGLSRQALDFASRAEALAREIGGLDQLWHSQLLAGRAYVSLDQPTNARAAFTSAIDTIETMRAQVAGTEQDSQRFFENKLSPYQAMVDLLIREKNLNEALTFAERAKARVLLDVLRGGRVNVTKAMTAEEQEQERQLTGKLVSLNSQIYRESLRSKPDETRLADLKTRLNTTRLEHEALQTKLYEAHPELKVKRGEAPPLRLDEAALLLPDSRSALLEYVVTEDKTYLFVLTKGGGDRQAGAVAQVFPLNIKAKELAERATSFRRQLAGRDLLYRETAVELYQLLLGPARSLLKGKRRLTIVPDDVLWELPFQALQPTPGRHLIEDSAVAYAPSLTLLREVNKARVNPKDSPAKPMSLLAVGNPLLKTQTVERPNERLMGADLIPLPEAEEQVKELQRLYGAEHSRVYVGGDAREDRVKVDAGKYQILHLATHGIFDDASPMYSQVVLANEEGNAVEDGFLEAWEIMNLDLHADLVVLSACETARGRVGAGEGMIGLSWALFVAGSPSTVVSQWKVDAASTTTLMLEFHRNLRAGNSKTLALQQATLKILEDRRYRHPFYWAPFVLIGDAN